MPRFVQCCITLIALISLWSTSPAFSSEALIPPEALQQKQQQANTVILDIQPLNDYRQAHIPGSIHTDYADWRRTNMDGLGEMLPDELQLASLIGGLGIDKQTKVVIVPIGRGADDLAAAARIYWTLYVAGLDHISILKGGIRAYINHFGRDNLASGDSRVTSRIFEPGLRQSHLISMKKVRHFGEMDFGIVDARSPEEFKGFVASSPAERPGAIPMAVNVPFDSLMNNSDDGLLDAESLRERFKSTGVSLHEPFVTYCHTGHRAALLWFASHQVLGNKNARLYDGSTLEWSATADRPLENRSKLKNL